MKGRVSWDRDGTPHYFMDGEEVSEKAFRAAFHPVSEEGRSGDALVGWSRPLASDAMGVHPSQVKEATEDARAKGVPTDFDEEGRPLLRDRNHRRRYMHAYGFFDRDGGYSDAQHGSTRGREKEPEKFDLSHLDEAEAPRGVEKRSSVRYFT